MKVCVLGAAGGIGQPLSLLLKLQLPAGSELSLYDVAPFTPGVAVDLSHIPTDVSVSGFVGDDLEAAMAVVCELMEPAGVFVVETGGHDTLSSRACTTETRESSSG